MHLETTLIHAQHQQPHACMHCRAPFRHHHVLRRVQRFSDPLLLALCSDGQCPDDSHLGGLHCVPLLQQSPLLLLMGDLQGDKPQSHGSRLWVG